MITITEIGSAVLTVDSVCNQFYLLHSIVKLKIAFLYINFFLRNEKYTFLTA